MENHLPICEGKDLPFCIRSDPIRSDSFHSILLTWSKRLGNQDVGDTLKLALLHGVNHPFFSWWRKCYRKVVRWDVVVAGSMVLSSRPNSDVQCKYTSIHDVLVVVDVTVINKLFCVLFCVTDESLKRQMNRLIWILSVKLFKPRATFLSCCVDTNEKLERKVPRGRKNKAHHVKWI